MLCVQPRSSCHCMLRTCYGRHISRVLTWSRVLKVTTKSLGENLWRRLLPAARRRTRHERQRSVWCNWRGALALTNPRQYILPPNSVVYTGCVGADARADFLSEANEREGVRSAYNVHPTLPTGACAVLLTGQDRCGSPRRRLLAFAKFALQVIGHEPRRGRSLRCRTLSNT